MAELKADLRRVGARPIDYPWNEIAALIDHFAAEERQDTLLSSDYGRST